MPAAAPAGWRSSSAAAAMPSSGSTSTTACSRRPAPRRPTSYGYSGDLTDPGLDLDGQTFDVVVMAGNVLIFVPPGSEGQVIENAARWLRPGGRLITGYSLKPDGFGPRQHDVLAARSGLVLQDRWSTWDKHPSTPGDQLRRRGPSAGNLSRIRGAHATEQQLCGPTVH